MGNLSRQILAEKENVEVVLSNLSEAMNREKKSVVELAAIGAFLHNIYNGIENILKQILKTKDIEVPKSDTSHKDLLNLSVSLGIISESLSDELYEYLTFRRRLKGYSNRKIKFLLIWDKISGKISLDWAKSKRKASQKSKLLSPISKKRISLILDNLKILQHKGGK